jgi:hypothetical protein
VKVCIVWVCVKEVVKESLGALDIVAAVERRRDGDRLQSRHHALLDAKEPIKRVHDDLDTALKHVQHLVLAAQLGELLPVVGALDVQPLRVVALAVFYKPDAPVPVPESGL